MVDELIVCHFLHLTKRGTSKTEDMRDRHNFDFRIVLSIGRRFNIFRENSISYIAAKLPAKVLRTRKDRE